MSGDSLMARTFAIAALLSGILAPLLARAEEPAPATKEQVQKTVDRALGYLQTESAAWMNTRKCAACHHVPMPLWAMGEASKQGYTVDKKFMAETTEAVLGSMQKMMASGLFYDPTKPPDPRPQGRALNTGTVFLAVA